MGCSSGGCSSGGCTSCSGGCSTGGCNKVNTYDWLTIAEIADPRGYQFVEVSFKNGSRKDFYKIKPDSQYTTGDWVAVDTDGGYDVGQITLSGELVALQIKKKKVRENNINNEVLRLANERDMERFKEARSIERDAMIRARAAAYSLNLNMKIGDVEYQCDMRKATFYFTSDTRVDFRELIRIYAKEFRVKIEMRQIGMRQESAKIGGLGTCGRELCCSTWLTSFKSVNTSAARYQNLSINQTKLSGQCGRLKCCLNFELDTYLDALDGFPQNVDSLKLKNGRAQLIKTDIFKGIMFYSYHEDSRNVIVALDKDTVADIKRDINKGILLDSLQQFKYAEEADNEEEEWGYDDDGTGEIELPFEKRKRKKRRKKPVSNSQTPKEEGETPQQPTRPESNRPSRVPKPANNNQDSSEAGEMPQQRTRPESNRPRRGPKHANKNQTPKEDGETPQQSNSSESRRPPRGPKPAPEANENSKRQEDEGKNQNAEGTDANQQGNSRPNRNKWRNKAARNNENNAEKPENPVKKQENEPQPPQNVGNGGEVTPNNKQKDRNRRYHNRNKKNPNSNNSNNNTNNQNS